MKTFFHLLFNTEAPKMTSTDQNDKLESHTKQKDQVNVTLDFNSLPNPYGFPPILLESKLKVDGSTIWHHPVKDDPVTHTKKIQSFPMRQDDIFIAAYMKCGKLFISLCFLITLLTYVFSGELKNGNGN